MAAGQDALSRLLVDGIAAAPPGSTPLAAVAAGLETAAGALTSFNRELGPKLQAAVAAGTERQERDALKQVGLVAAMAAALRTRGVPDPAAGLAAELGVLAFKAVQGGLRPLGRARQPPAPRRAGPRVPLRAPHGQHPADLAANRKPATPGRL